MKTIFLAMMLVAVSAKAQSAKVVQLAPEETMLARSLYEQQEILTKKTKEFREKLEKKYLMDHHSAHPISNMLWGAYLVGSDGDTIKPGWGTGDFEFSEDYKFIVPARPAEPIRNWSSCPYYGVVPASGTFTYR